eukprot:Hpha_TRINITY_DN10997_c0_g1::TRINITY_DN10997_c0_g1_i1::g.26971::m.26971
MREDSHLTVFNAAAEVPGGILNADDLTPLTLLGAKIEVVVEHCIARVKITQEVGHARSKPLRTIFACPLERDWTVVAWSVSTSRGDASAIASDRACQHTAFREGVFVAPVPWAVHPGDTVLASISFLTNAVPVNGSEQNFSVVIPKGVLPNDRQARSGWLDHFRLGMKLQLAQSIGLHVRVLGHNKVEGVAIPNQKTPQATVSRVDYHAELMWSKPHGEMNVESLSEDIDIRIDIRADPQSLLRLEVVAPKDEDCLPDEDLYALGLSIYPTSSTLAAVAGGESVPDASRPNTEAVFLVDCSGSMAESFAHCRDAVLAGVQALPASCLFNVMAFGTAAPGGVRALAEEALEYRDEALDAARDFVGRLEANLGGTCLFDALRHAYTRPLRRGYCRQVYLVTDAVAGDAHSNGSLRSCVQLARDHRSSARLWCLGLRPHCDETLLRSIAEASGGGHEPIDSSADLPTRLLGLMETSLVPCLTAVALSFSREGEHEESELAHIRPCYSSLPLIFLGRRHTALHLSSKSLAPDTAVTLSGLMGDHEVSVTDHVQELTPDNKKLRRADGQPQDLLTHAAAARDRLRSLIEPEWEWKRWTASSGQERCVFAGDSGPAAKHEGEIVRLGRTFNMATPLTSMRVVSGAEVTDASPEVALEYPYYLPPDPRRERLQSRAMPRERLRALRLAADGRQVSDDHTSAPPPKPRQTTADFMRGIALEMVASVTDPAWPSLGQVLEMQRADGRWEPTERLAHSLGASLKELLAAQPSPPGGGDEGSVDYSAAWATAVVCELLGTRFKDSERLWYLMRRRAEQYLTTGGCAAWRETAAKFLSKAT